MINAIVEPWIQTYSGRKFDFLNIDVNTIDITDIAHALSNLCRYTGHTKYFYSVAQHSVLAAISVPQEYKFAALLHDATEAYINDISKPLKNLLPQYCKIEDDIWLKIAEKFGLPEEIPALVKEVDLRLLVTEKRDLLETEPDEWTIIDKIKPYEEKIIPWSPEYAKERFIKTFNLLI